MTRTKRLFDYLVLIAVALIMLYIVVRGMTE